MSTRRLFTAVLPPTEAIVELEDFLDHTGIRRMASDAAWVKPHRWHITTAFLPAVGHLELERFEDLLATVAERSQPFRLRLRGAGVFMQHARGVPMWIGLDGDVDALEQLTLRCRTAAARADIRHDSGRSFTPHVTVARKAERVDTGLWVERLNTFEGDWFEVHEFVLVESIASTKDKPPAYDVLARFSL